MKKSISLISPSRNNLKYLKWSYGSVRKNAPHDIEYCIASDYSNDGTVEWCEEMSKKDKYFKYIVNDGTWFGENKDEPKRMGHTLLYDKLIEEVATGDIIIIWHADMYMAPGAIESIVKNIKEKTVVSMTRIEPPLHPPGQEKILFDFGIEPEKFDENGFLKLVEMKKRDNVDKITNGIFAPWAVYKKDFIAIGGHDPLYAPQSREDSVKNDRILILIENDEIKLMRIEDLFKKYHYLSENDNEVEYIDFKHHNIKIATATANDNQSVGRNYINKIIKKKNTKEMVEITTKWGRTVCTVDHSLLDYKINPVKPHEINENTIWSPLKINEWNRKTIKNIDFNEIKLNINDNKKRKSNNINYKFPVIRNIDEYGNNQQLIDICEFLGFFVAEGSTSINYDKNSYYFSFDSNNLEMLNYFKNKSLSLFTNLKYNRHQISKKENCVDVYKINKGSKQISHFLRNLVGENSSNKKVPDFIFNIPKVYQEAFLYGYLCGDGYLGTNINRQKNNINFSVDKRLFFHKKIFNSLTWKSTSKSDILTAGIIYLLRKNFPDIKVRIDFPTDEKNVYNLSTVKEFNGNKLKIKNLGILDCDVYDLEVQDTHTFIDAMGLVGLHNSDIFNRFILSGYESIQVWDAYVYHMTCRGSRYNPEITKVGKESTEWLEHNKKSERNFTRKWGHMVSTDSRLVPIIFNKYDIGFVVHKCFDKALYLLEPWCDNIYVDYDYSEYINSEQPNTKYNLNTRIKNIDDEKTNSIIVEFDASLLTVNRMEFIYNLSQTIEQTNQIGKFTYDIFQIEVKDLLQFQSDLIYCNKEAYNTDNTTWYIEGDKDAAV